MEERVDEVGGHFKESWQLGLQELVVLLVLAGSELEILLNLGRSSSASLSERRPGQLTHLEQVFLVRERLLLLLPQLVQAVIMSVKVDQLVVSLDTSLPDLLADLDQFLARRDNSGIDQLQFRCQGV